MGAPIRVDPAELEAVSQLLAGVRTQLLGARRTLLGPTSDTVGVEPVDRAVHGLIDRCQRGLVEVASDLQFLAAALAAAADRWRETDRAVGGACW
jgi:hypothetical protein